MANIFSADPTCKALWRFESGALTVDSIGANALTLHNTPTADVTHFQEGAAALLCSISNNSGADIADASLDVGFPLKTGDSLKQITICGWFRPTSIQTSVLLCKFANAAGDSFMFIQGSNSWSLGWVHSGGLTWWSGIGSVSINTFYHITLSIDGVAGIAKLRIWDGSTATNYINSFGSTLDVGGSPFSIGYASWGTAPFGGQIDEVVVFNRLLSDTESDEIRNGIFGSDFPLSLTGAVDDETEILAKHLNNLEAKVGVNNSMVPTSLDYLIKSAGGWIPFPATWTYASADAPTFTFTIPGDQTGLLSPGMRIQLTQTTVKYFIITAVSYSSPNTTVTVYGGTDYTLASAAITAPFFSSMKAPHGFPLDPAKWTVTLTDTTDYSQASPDGETWYNLGGISIEIPIGVWIVRYNAAISQLGAAGNIVKATLSTSNDGESDVSMSIVSVTPADSAMLYVEKTDSFMSISSKTAYYFNMAVWYDEQPSSLNVYGTYIPTVITAVCAYL